MKLKFRGCSLVYRTIYNINILSGCSLVYYNVALYNINIFNGYIYSIVNSSNSILIQSYSLFRIIFLNLVSNTAHAGAVQQISIVADCTSAAQSDNAVNPDEVGTIQIYKR
jgi:hypothetical protein